MTNRELKEEKKELRELLFSKIAAIKGKDDLDAVAKVIDCLNVDLDNCDTRGENFVDNINLCFSSSAKSRMKKKIDDILDNYDKVDKNGIAIYDEIKKTEICDLITEINSICDRNFWNRFKNMLRIGS